MDFADSLAAVTDAAGDDETVHVAHVALVLGVG